jgi:hypothetical protein
LTDQRSATTPTETESKVKQAEIQTTKSTEDLRGGHLVPCDYAVSAIAFSMKGPTYLKESLNDLWMDVE